jgi:hypothetical protein
MGSKLKAPRAFHEPYKMTYLDQKFNDFEGCQLSKTYREYGRTRKFASDFLWKMKKNPLVKRKYEYYDYILWQILAIVNNV